MKILFIGGTGLISSACSELALQRGMDLYILNRGVSQKYPFLAGAQASDLAMSALMKRVLPVCLRPINSMLS